MTDDAPTATWKVILKAAILVVVIAAAIDFWSVRLVVGTLAGLWVFYWFSGLRRLMRAFLAGARDARDQKPPQI